MGTACCDAHDRLDKKLHVHAYTAMACGSPSVKIAEVPGNPGVMNPVPNPEPDADGRVGMPIFEPAYCCNKCPTLKAAILAEANAPV